MTSVAVVRSLFLHCVIKRESKKTPVRRAFGFYCVMVPLVDLRCSKPQLCMQTLVMDGGDICYWPLTFGCLSRIKATFTISHKETSCD